MESKKTVNIALDVKEIIFDIQNKTFLTGRSREAENTKNYEAASHIQVSDDDENAYQIVRSVANAFSGLKTVLAEYLDEDTTDTDNQIVAAIDSQESLTVTLKMPSNYNTAAADALGAGVHQYLVCRAIADWFAITNKDEADDYRNLADQALEAARRALYKRRRPSRPQHSEES